MTATTSAVAVALDGSGPDFLIGHFQDQPLQCTPSPDLTTGIIAKLLTTFLLSCLSLRLKYFDFLAAVSFYSHLLILVIEYFQNYFPISYCENLYAPLNIGSISLFGCCNQ